MMKMMMMMMITNKKEKNRFLKYRINKFMIKIILKRYVMRKISVMQFKYITKENN
jgi:hypothetical protein